MQREMQRDEARKVLRSALWLARERAVGDLEEKKIARERISDLESRMGIGTDSQPTAGDLLEVLGDDDAEIRAALAAW